MGMISDLRLREPRFCQIIERFYKLLLGMIREKNDEKLFSFPHRAKDGV